MEHSGDALRAACRRIRRKSARRLPERASQVFAQAMEIPSGHLSVHRVKHFFKSTP